MKHTLFYISSLLVLAGCSTELTGPQPPSGPSALASYFWTDSTVTYMDQYQISTTGDIHSLSLQHGGAVTDLDNDSSKTTTLTILRTGTSFSMSGFTASDFFQLGSYFQVVHDTTPPAPRIESIRSIATLNPKFGYGTVFAASDSVLYQIDLASNALEHPDSLPVRGLTLAEDVSGSGVYAFQLGGRGIFWTSDGGAHWASDSTPPGTTITAFASSKYGGDFFWVACGGQLFDFSYSNIFGKAVSCPLGRVTALEATPDGVIACGADGEVYDVARFGSAHLVGKTLKAISILGIAGNYITTTLPGIFDYTKTDTAIISADDSAIYFTGASVFAGRSDGSVDRLSSDSVGDVRLPAPNPGMKVTQFAYPYQGGHDPTKGIYAVAGGQVYYRQDANTWVPVNQNVSPPSQFAPGALTLLRTDVPTWIAGYTESSYKGVQKGYGYRATTAGPFAQVALGTSLFNNVFVVSYATESNGAADTLNAPQYTIYFQSGKGPIRIDRAWNGKSITISKEN
ncbi:MAG: hypothetical protein ACHQNE_07740 [Candidatus Kapaibacterium sp.]